MRDFEVKMSAAHPDDVRQDLEDERKREAEVLDLKAINAAVQKVVSGFEDMKQVNDEVQEQIKNFGEADVLSKDKLARIDKVLDTQQDLLDRHTATINRMRAGGMSAKDIDHEREMKNWLIGICRHRDVPMPANFDQKAAQDYIAAFDTFVRKGEKTLSDAETKALSVGIDGDGGFFVPVDMSGRMVEKIYETSSLRPFANVQTISTTGLEGTYDNEEAEFGWAMEKDPRTETSTPGVDRWYIPVHELWAMPKATQRVLDDAVIDIEAWLARKVAARFARGENAAFVTGDGVDKPRGFLTYPNGTADTGEIQQFATGQAGEFAAAPAGGDVLIDALYGLKAQHRSAARWYMNRATTAKTRKLKDSDGAYLWSPGIAAGQPSTLLGYPVEAFEDMPNPANNSLSIAVGDMGEGYQIVERQGVRLLRDPYSAKPWVLFYSTKRVGGDVVNFEALKLVRFGA